MFSLGGQAALRTVDTGIMEPLRRRGARKWLGVEDVEALAQAPPPNALLDATSCLW